jgi:hypothetical protein
MCVLNKFNCVSGLCEVESGQSNIILDIEESRGKCEYRVPNWVIYC